MTEAEWLASAEPVAMLELLKMMRACMGGKKLWPNRPSEYIPTDRKLRLFACACCRQVWDGTPCPWANPDPAKDHGGKDWREMACTCHGTGRVGGLADPRSRRAVEVAERYADGEPGLADRLRRCRSYLDVSSPHEPAWVLAYNACRVDVSRISDNQRAVDLAIPPATQAALLREVFGNPFHTRGGAGFISSLPSGGMSAGIHEPGGLPSLPSILRWHDGTIPRMARTIYQERRWQDMPILADALEDAGCEDEEILRHCRDGGPHVRGCHVIDLLLGKE